jgi:hypothetical protein
LGREPYFYEYDFLPLLGTIRIILEAKKPREHILIYPVDVGGEGREGSDCRLR